MSSNKRPRYLSLFCGCGGFDEGFDKAGYECVGAFDNDSSVLEVFRQNLPGPTYKHDLTNPQLPIRIEPNTIDVIVSGSPCQGFSTAGLRQLDDPRNSLLLVGGAITLQLQPKVFIAENVMGSFSGPHKQFWDQLNEMLTGNGYSVKLIKCDATHFGLAQTRKRVLMVAWKGTKTPTLVFPVLPSKNLEDVLQGLDGLPNQDIYHPINSKAKEIIAHIMPGRKLCNVRGGNRAVHTWQIPSVFGEVSEAELHVLNQIKDLRRKLRIRENGDADPVLQEDIQRFCSYDISSTLDSLIAKGYVRKKDNRYDLVHSFNGLYRRLEWDKPSMTVDTRFGNPRFFLHPEKMRGFSVREAARIQGFRDSFVFTGSTNSQYKMIGNAVPPPMAFAVATLIKETLLDE